MIHPTHTPQREISTMYPQEKPKTGRLEGNTLPGKAFCPVLVNEVGPQHDYVYYRKPSLLDAPVDKLTKHDLERLLEVNHDAFAEDERQIGITPSFKCSLTLVTTCQ